MTARLLLAAALLLAAVPVRAEMDQKDVQKIVEKVQAGKGFVESGAAPSPQTVRINAGFVAYVVDVRAQLCFAGAVNSVDSRIVSSLTTVPCAAIKKGYPVFAALITWD